MEGYKYSTYIQVEKYVFKLFVSYLNKFQVYKFLGNYFKYSIYSYLFFFFNYKIYTNGFQILVQTSELVVLNIVVRLLVDGNRDTVDLKDKKSWRSGLFIDRVQQFATRLHDKAVTVTCEIFVGHRVCNSITSTTLRYISGHFVLIPSGLNRLIILHHILSCHPFLRRPGK